MSVACKCNNIVTKMKYILKHIDVIRWGSVGMIIRGSDQCFRVQLWGAAVPMNRLENGDQCVFDGAHNAGICGDWFGDPSIEGAAISGLDLAEKIAAHAQGNRLFLF